jgi:hypothetical protein
LAPQFYRGTELVRCWNACAQNGIDEKGSNENRISAAFSVEMNSGIDGGPSGILLAVKHANDPSVIADRTSGS